MVIARSKLVAPRLPPEATWVDGLVERLAARTSTSRLTLLRANGGSGKTTLARAIVETAGRPWGWTALDEHDDLAAAVELVAAALTAAHPRLGDELADLPAPTGADAPHAAAVAITNAVVDAELDGVIVVVDDAHRCNDPQVHELLAMLVECAPPGMHLVVTTRTAIAGLGGARAVAMGDVVAVDAEVLRVDEHVAAHILDGLGWQGDPTLIPQIVERVGGWVLGVRLMATMGTTEPSTDDLVRRYVEQEVLAGHDRGEVAALERCAVLDEVSVGTVAGMVDTTDPRGWLAGLVDDLPLLVERVGPGLVRLHDLLRDVLLERLASTDRLAAAHQRAAAVATTWQRRADHLLEAGSHTAAAQLLARAARDEFPRPTPLGQVAERARRLPAEVLADDPWLRIVLGVVDVQRSAADTALAWLEPALREVDDDLLAHWAGARSAIVVGADVAAWSTRLVALEDDDDFGLLPVPVRTDHHIAVAHGMVFAGRADEAAARHDLALRTARGARDVDALEVVAQHQSPWLAQIPGGVDRIRRHAAWVEREIADPTPILRLGGRAQRAMIALFGGELDAVIPEVVAAGPLAERLRLAYLRPGLDWALASAWLARGDLAPAADLLEDRLHGGGPIAPSWVAALARVRAAQGDVDRLGDVVHPAPGAVAGPLRPVLDTAAVVAKAVLARATGDADAAVAMLDDVCERLAPLVVLPSIGRPQLDLVVALEAAERHDDALRLLLDELGMLERRELLGMIACTGPALRPVLRRAARGAMHVTVAERALAIVTPADRPAAVGLADGGQLSPREVQILRLVAAGHSNREIADRLVISVNTVKTHVRNVLAKLGVGSRAAAAARATRLGLSR